MSNAVNVTLYSVPSETDFRKSYEVRFYEDGSAKCSCPSWTYDGRPDTTKRCKHVRGLVQKGKGFLAPKQTQTKVFRLKHEDSEIVFVDGSDFLDALEQAVDALGVRKTLSVERIA